MIRYAAQRYGVDHVAQIVTFSTIKARAAVRDASRVLDYPYVGRRQDRQAHAAAASWAATRRCDACLEPDPRYEDGYKMAPRSSASSTRRIPTPSASSTSPSGLEGLRRQDGIHAAAVVITREPLTEYLPIQRKPEPGAPIEDRPIVTQYEMHGVEDLGLLKMDFLGLRNLDVIEIALELIERHARASAPTSTTSRSTTRRRSSCCSAGDTIGVFQLEGGPMRALMRSLAPTTFEDVCRARRALPPGADGAELAQRVRRPQERAQAGDATRTRTSRRSSRPPTG